MDLKNDYTTGQDRNPKNRQEVLHLLDKYSKSNVIVSTANGNGQGSSFAQRGGDGRFGASFDVQYWKAKQCYNCNKKGHPSSHCPEKAKEKAQVKAKAKDDDDKSVSSKSSKASIAKLQKDFKKTKKSFTTLQTQIKELEHEDSDISDSDESGSSHFQFNNKQDCLEGVHKSTGVPIIRCLARSTSAQSLQSSMRCRPAKGC